MSLRKPPPVTLAPVKHSIAAFTDYQIKLISDLARPLQVWRRGEFLRRIAARLHGRTAIGDGELYRQALAVQRAMLQGYDDLPPAA